jgi:hypothetical protein
MRWHFRRWSQIWTFRFGIETKAVHYLASGGDEGGGRKGRRKAETDSLSRSQSMQRKTEVLIVAVVDKVFFRFPPMNP